MKFLDRADALAKRLEGLFTGGRAQDALYVTNRSVGQKVRFYLLIGTPVLAIAVFISLVMMGYFDTKPKAERAVTPKEPTGEVTAKVLPHVEKDLAVSNEYSRDIEVLEAAVSRGGDRTVSGKIRNTTDHAISVAELIFDITDDEGSQLGGVSVRVENVPPHAIVPFKSVLQQQNARSALVREVHSR
jgi:hypothetical protein